MGSFLLWLLVFYVFLDLMSGLYHVATDRGYNIRSQVELFNAHHDANSLAEFDCRPMLLGVPWVIAAAWSHSPYWITTGLMVCLVQLPHYWAHQKDPGLLARYFQRFHLVIGHQHHQDHHSGRFDKNFCIISGWNDFWLNYVVKWWDALHAKNRYGD